VTASSKKFQRIRRALLHKALDAITTGSLADPHKRELQYALTHSPNRPFQDYRAMPREKKKNVARKPPQMVSVAQPRELAANSVVRSWYRFGAASAQVGTAITVGNLLGCQGSVVVTAILIQSVFTSFRVKKVRMWAPAAAVANSLMECVWTSAGAQNKDDVKIGSTVGSANSSYFESKPPPKSFSEMWTDPGTPANTVFLLTCPVGTIVDVHLEGTLSNGFAQPTGVAFVNTAGFPLGKLFYPPLDGPGTHNLSTQGRPSTF